MRRLASLLIAIIIVISVLPGAAFAIEADEPEFQEFLEGIGWQEEEYIEYLESKNWYLEDFWYVDELGLPLTDESIQPVLEDFNMTREELHDLLYENGELLEGQDVLESEWIVFTEDLWYTIDYYVNGWTETPIDDVNLQELLDFYGFESREELETLLNDYHETLEDYAYIEDLEYAIDLYMYEDEYYEDEYSDEAYGITPAFEAIDALLIFGPIIIQLLFF
ncbi:processed acidic surface protein [Oceanobacillus saliphilus]|uniref:processed acidic surface protein n=1 Tax=Oceanobacillus saliphilus TaxID=2925834 RepID=UPI00201D48BE|nr:processed acidic surface protein [Oceanobacillus saliphilus]